MASRRVIGPIWSLGEVATEIDHGIETAEVGIGRDMVIDQGMGEVVAVVTVTITSTDLVIETVRTRIVTAMVEVICRGVGRECWIKQTGW